MWSSVGPFPRHGTCTPAGPKQRSGQAFARSHARRVLLSADRHGSHTAPLIILRWMPPDLRRVAVVRWSDPCPCGPRGRVVQAQPQRHPSLAQLRSDLRRSASVVCVVVSAVPAVLLLPCIAAWAQIDFHTPTGQLAPGPPGLPGGSQVVQPHAEKHRNSWRRGTVASVRKAERWWTSLAGTPFAPPPAPQVIGVSALPPSVLRSCAGVLALSRLPATQAAHSH